MALSDFPSSIARVRAGECPLCGGSLDGMDEQTTDNAVFTWPSFEDVIRELSSYAVCRECRVGWRIVGVHDPLPEHGQAFGLGPMLVPSRKLTEDEALKIFSRPVDG